MKCQKCGADLADGVLYCRECGAKVEVAAPTKRFCRDCGAENEAGAKFCTNCGANLFVKVEADAVRETDTTNPSPSSSQQFINSTQPSTSGTIRDGKPVNPSVKTRTGSFWNKLDLFMKIALISIAVITVFLLVAIFAKKTAGIIISAIQLVGLVVAILMHKGTIKQPSSWFKWLVLGASALLIVLNIMSYSWEKTEQTTVSNNNSVSASERSERSAAPATNFKIIKGSQYAFMSDEANVYIANAISDSIITVECWGRNLLTEKSVKHEYDIGTFKINDPAVGFSWIDEEHTAFTFLLQDSNNSHTKKQQSVIFTINVSDDDEFKGTDFNEDIICYTYRNDDWNIYRAIPLTRNLIKIENWGRSSSIKGTAFIYNYDLYIVDENNTDTDFEWTDEERTSFTITLEDPQNEYYIKEPKFVAFTVENPSYSFDSVLSYLNAGKTSESSIQADTSSQVEQKDYYYGTWKTCGLVISTGEYYTVEELEKLGNYNVTDFYTIFKETGAYVYIQGTVYDNVTWKTTGDGVIVGTNVMTLEDGKLHFSSGDEIVCFEKISSSQDEKEIKPHPHFSTSAEVEKTPASASNDATCKLYIEVEFVENLFFSKYNAELYLDDQLVDTLAHGKFYTTTCKVKPGKHTITFKEENGSNRGSASFTITKDSTFTCRINTTSTGIDISNKNLTESLDNTLVTMPNTVGMLYSEALEVLKQTGLTNISYETVGDHFIWIDSNWLVQGQNVDAGTNIPKSEDIKLECISLEDYWKATYIGKNINEIQKLADEKGFTIIFQDKSEKSLDVNSMDSKTKEDWVATGARQYSFTGSTAVVTVEFTGIPTPTPIPTNTPAPTATEGTASSSSTNTPKATSTPKPTKKASSADYHSSNDREVAKKGNSGVFAYKKRGTNYDQYYIIDFDKGYVYYFCHGNGDGSCDRIKITSGDLNSYVLITYHDGGTTWQEALRFHYKNMPDTMILEDHNHYEYKFSATNLNDALKLRDKLKIVDY